MNHLDEKLYKYLGSKELSFGCKVRHWYTMNPEVKGEEQIGTVTENRGRWILLLEGYTVEEHEIIGHEPRIDDLHKWLNDNVEWWRQSTESIVFLRLNGKEGEEEEIMFYSGKSLMEQSDTKKEAIVKLIEEYGN